MSIETSKNRRKKKRAEKHATELRDSSKRYNICVMGIPEGEKKNRRNISSNNDPEFPKVMSDTKAQIQEDQRIPKVTAPRHITFKL